jgi:hypothetical protein
MLLLLLLVLAAGVGLCLPETGIGQFLLLPMLLLLLPLLTAAG